MYNEFLKTLILFLQMENPWDVQSIYELQYFNCPSCVFKNQSKQVFVNHAFYCHPNSVHCLSKINDESFTDIICPWNRDDAKVDESDSLKVLYQEMKLTKSYHKGL